MPGKATDEDAWEEDERPKRHTFSCVRRLQPPNIVGGGTRTETHTSLKGKRSRRAEKASSTMKLQGVRGNAVPNPAEQGRDKQGANTCVSGGLKKLRKEGNTGSREKARGRRRVPAAHETPRQALTACIRLFRWRCRRSAFCGGAPNHGLGGGRARLSMFRSCC